MLTGYACRVHRNRPIGPAPKRSEIARDLVALPGRRRKSRLAALGKRLELCRVADEREPRTWRLDRQTVERIEAMVSIANGDVHTARMHFGGSATAQLLSGAF